MAKKHFEISMDKKILSDTDFARRVNEEFSADVRRNLSVQIVDLSTQDEAEVLALFVGFSPAFENEDRPRYAFRVDRRGIQDLVDVLYDLVKYEKSEGERGVDIRNRGKSE